MVQAATAAGAAGAAAGIYSWHTPSPLVLIKHYLIITASIVPDRDHPFMTTLHPSSDGYYRQDNMSQCLNHLRLVSSTWQRVHCTALASTVPRSQSSRAPLGCGVTRDLHPANVQQLCDALPSIWTKSLMNISNNLLNLRQTV